MIYDPELGSALSSQVTAASGFNALAHAVEALYSPAGTRLRPASGGGHPALGRRPSGAGGAERRVRNGPRPCWGLLGSATATAAGTALQHKLAHVLGGTHDLTHAELHAVLLPHVTAYNQPASGDLLDGAAAALDAPDTATGLWRLGRQIGNPTSLAELGLDKEVLDDAAEQTVIEVGAANPRPVDRRAVMALLEDAYAGRTPRTNEEDGDG